MDRYKKGFVEELPAGYCTDGPAPWKDIHKQSERFYLVLGRARVNPVSINITLL